MTQIAVVCTSTTISQTDLAFIVDAWDKQSREFCAAHGIEYIPVVLYTDPSKLPVASGECRVLTIEDDIDAPGAEGFHDDELGLIFARVLTENNADAGSHECCEESKDPTCDEYAPWDDKYEQAVEACDRVEGDNYLQQAQVGDETREIPVTNWLYPSAFDPNGKAPFDKMGKLTTWNGLTPGGYVILRDKSTGDTTDVFAKKLGGSSPTTWPPGAMNDDRVRGTVVSRHPDGSVKDVVYGGPRVVYGGERGRLAAEKKRARPDSRLSRRLARLRPATARPPSKPSPQFG